MGEFLTRNGLFGPGAARPRGRKQSSENSKKMAAGPISKFHLETCRRKKRVPCATRGDKNFETLVSLAAPTGAARLPCRIGRFDGGARRHTCRRCRTRAIITGDHGAPVAAIRLTMNTLSSAGGKVTATILQAGIG
jgi:hypothetical protein